MSYVRKFYFFQAILHKGTKCDIGVFAQTRKKSNRISIGLEVVKSGIDDPIIVGSVIRQFKLSAQYVENRDTVATIWIVRAVYAQVLITQDFNDIMRLWKTKNYLTVLRAMAKSRCISGRILADDFMIWGKKLNISEIIWLEDIVDKLKWKHNVDEYEIIEILNNKPLFRFIEKGTFSLLDWL